MAIDQQQYIIEPEMQERSGLYFIPNFAMDLFETLGNVLTQSFIAQPFLGNVIVNTKQNDLIHKIANQTLTDAISKISSNNYAIDDFYSDILVLDIALLLRN